LPEILPKGIKLQVTGRNENHIHFNVTRSENIPAQQIYIRAKNRGLVYWMATASLKKEQILFNLPLAKFPQGIVEVTIFDENFVPLAERLVYTNLDQKLHITLKESSKKTYRQKDKVSLTFEVKDQHQKPVVANLSLSVHDHLYDNKNNDYAMLPHYYLFSELKGHVYDASYYFDAKNKKREKHLDFLMLTQGWRTYVWNTTNYQTAKTLFFNQEIHGKAYVKTNTGTLQNASVAELQLISPKRIETIQTDSTGYFKVPKKFIQLVKGEPLYFLTPGDEVKIDLYDHFKKIEKFTQNKQLQFPKDDAIKTKAFSSSYDRVFTFDGMNYLDEVVLIDYKKRQKERHAQRVIQYGQFPPSGVIDYPGKSTDFICYEFHTLNCTNHPAGPPPLDGRRYYLNNGSLVIYRAPEKKQKKKKYTSLKSMYLTKKFYSPKYDTADEKLMPDNRKTIFWEPNLVSNANGELTVTFYTSDVQTTFLGRLEGTNGDGLLGATIFKFEVN
jgi:hypothetical protein